MADHIKTQADLVREAQGFKPKEEIHKLHLPGIADLHTRSSAEIAEVLTMVLKSEPGIKELRYRVGEYVELTVETQ